MSEHGLEDRVVTRAESTPDNLRRRADKDMERARKADKDGDPDSAQGYRNQAFVKYAIAWGLLTAAIAALTATAEGKEFLDSIGTSLCS